MEFEGGENDDDRKDAISSANAGFGPSEDLQVDLALNNDEHLNLDGAGRRIWLVKVSRRERACCEDVSVDSSVRVISGAAVLAREMVECQGGRQGARPPARIQEVRLTPQIAERSAISTTATCISASLCISTNFLRIAFRFTRPLPNGDERIALLLPPNKPGEEEVPTEYFMTLQNKATKFVTDTIARPSSGLANISDDRRNTFIFAEREDVTIGESGWEPGRGRARPNETGDEAKRPVKRRMSLTSTVQKGRSMCLNLRRLHSISGMPTLTGTVHVCEAKSLALVCSPDVDVFGSISMSAT